MSHDALNAEALRWAFVNAENGTSQNNPAGNKYTLAACPRCVAAGENVGHGASGVHVFFGFLANETARDNIDHGGPGRVGIGAVRANDTTYVVVMFGFLS